MQLREKCGLFGIFGNNTPDVSRMVYYGLWALQHRGQESSGIVSTDGKHMYCHKGHGLVAHVYDEKDIRSLQGHIAIGHNRYATSGISAATHAQPVHLHQGELALAHNGNIPDVSKMRRFLNECGIATNGMNDSELMYKIVEYFITKGLSANRAVEKAFPYFTGAFCLLIMTKRELIAVRDECGIRPLCLGKVNGTYVVASETCALDVIGATYVRDILPGEMVVIDKKGIRSKQLSKNATSKLDIFELIYFARPDSQLMGKSVYAMREKLGERLAKETKIVADIVVPVPDSAIPAAIGFSRSSGIPLEQALVKNRYIHRTFITPAQKQRNMGVKMKLNVIQSLVKGKKVILVDDSIVRGTTSKQLVQMFKKYGGALEVHLFIPSPPVFYPDFYGINTPDQSELIATQKSLKELTRYVGATSVRYLSFQGMMKALGVEESDVCTSCFSGIYPIAIGKNEKNVKKVDEKTFFE